MFGGEFLDGNAQRMPPNTCTLQEIPAKYSLRANVSFNGQLCDDCPVKGRALSFKAGDFLYVRRGYDNNWWTSCLIKEDFTHVCGLAPSASKLDEIFRKMNESRTSTTLSSIKSRFSSYIFGGTETDESLLTITPMFKKRNYSFYDVVPLTRPIVIMGPSSKHYEVTRLLQRAIIDRLKKHFRDRIIVVSIGSLANNPPKTTAFGCIPTTKADDIALTKEEIEHLYQLCQKNEIVVIDCDNLNHPSQLEKWFLAPVIVYLKLHPKVLELLIKTRGESQIRHLREQMAAAEKLDQCPPHIFDIILEHYTLDRVCEYLIEHIMWICLAKHPPSDPHNLDLELLRGSNGMGKPGTSSKLNDLMISEPNEEEEENEVEENEEEGDEEVEEEEDGARCLPLTAAYKSRRLEVQQCDREPDNQQRQQRQPLKRHSELQPSQQWQSQQWQLQQQQLQQQLLQQNQQRRPKMSQRRVTFDISHVTNDSRDGKQPARRTWSTISPNGTVRCVLQDPHLRDHTHASAV